MERRAPAGMVTNQEVTISLNICMLIEVKPPAKPTPITAPTRVCVVEIGNPSFEANRMVALAPNSAAKPRLGVKSVMPEPIVSITLHPHVASPITMKKPPKGNV